MNFLPRNISWYIYYWKFKVHEKFPKRGLEIFQIFLDIFKNLKVKYFIVHLYSGYRSQWRNLVAALMMTTWPGLWSPATTCGVCRVLQGVSAKAVVKSAKTLIREIDRPIATDLTQLKHDFINHAIELWRQQRFLWRNSVDTLNDCLCRAQLCESET